MIMVWLLYNYNLQMITIYLSYDYLMITLNPKYSILEYYEVIQK